MLPRMGIELHAELVAPGPWPRPRFGEDRDELAAIWARLDHLAIFVDESRPTLRRLNRLLDAAERHPVARRFLGL